MTDIAELAVKLNRKIEWQKLPAGMSRSEKNYMLQSAIIEGIENLFVVTGRAAAYENYVTKDEDEFNYDLLLDEKLYVMCYAEMVVYQKVRTQYTDLLGYTTNALTVTNADKPYAYMTGTIDELKKRLELYYYKMVRFSHLT